MNLKNTVASLHEKVPDLLPQQGKMTVLGCQHLSGSSVGNFYCEANTTESGSTSRGEPHTVCSIRSASSRGQYLIMRLMVKKERQSSHPPITAHVSFQLSVNGLTKNAGVCWLIGKAMRDLCTNQNWSIS